MLIFSMAVVSPFVISFFLKDLYHCWSLQPPLFFISLYTLYTALPQALMLCRVQVTHTQHERCCFRNRGAIADLRPEILIAMAGNHGYGHAGKETADRRFGNHRAHRSRPR